MYTTEAGDARLAATWLNASTKTPAARRILTLRDELLALLRLREPGRAQYLQRMGLPELNRRLERYWFSPMLSLDPKTNRFQSSQSPKSVPGPTAILKDGTREILIRESTVAAALVRLAAQRRLNMLHRCDACEKWHVAPRSIDRFCSDQCRTQWHAQSPEYLDRRRQIQREYRARVTAKIAAENAALKGRN